MIVFCYRDDRTVIGAFEKDRLRVMDQRCADPLLPELRFYPEGMKVASLFAWKVTTPRWAKVYKDLTDDFTLDLCHKQNPISSFGIPHRMAIHTPIV
jgi:hypothetical protein